MNAKKIWFNVPLCRDCWDRVVPDREPVSVLIPNTCVRCHTATDKPIHVRVCWPNDDLGDHALPREVPPRSLPHTLTLDADLIRHLRDAAWVRGMTVPAFLTAVLGIIEPGSAQQPHQDRGNYDD